MTQFLRAGTFVVLATVAGLLLAGCTVPQGTVTARQNSDGTVTVTILPPPGSNRPTQTVLVPKGVIPPRLLPPIKPGNGGSAGAEPVVPTKPSTPNPPASSVTNPTKPPAPAQPTSEKARLEAAYGITITGKDQSNPEYLRMLEYAIGLYPAGSMRGLTVSLDQQSLDRTGGVGGTWQVRGGKALITLYQSGEAYVHIAIHEFAHHLDLYTNRGRPTPDLMDAAKVNGTIPAQNIPSAYAKHGLQKAESNPEWGAEVISWSLDKRGVPGFQATPTWRPTANLVTRLEKYVERGKIVFYRAP